MALSRLISDSQLSLEGGVRWLTTVPVPSWCIWARQAIWSEPWFPSPRCLFGCEIIAVTTRSAQSENPGAASRILYWQADDREGWWPGELEDTTGHGGELIRLDSFKHATPATLYTPTIKAVELARLRSRRSTIADYWQRFVRQNPAPTWPALTGVVVPPQPKGLLARLWGGA